MVQSNDGFVISKKDLELRGPGEILGIRQSGIPTFKLANMIKHNDILSNTQKDIKDLLLKYKTGEDNDIINFVNSKSKEIFNGYKLS
jgi:ATP-dependent DNA helicase RecG